MTLNAETKADNRELSDLFGVCPYVTAQKILSGKWKLVILYFLSQGTMRFTELSKCMPGVTYATLTSQLRALEGDGMVERRVYAEVPPRVEYLLTPLGKEFISVLDAINVFGETYIRKQGYVER